MTFKKFVITNLFVAILLTVLCSALPIGSCIPNPCPEDHVQSNRTCSNGVCSVNCSYAGGCSASYTTVFSGSEYLPDLDVPSYSGARWKYFTIASYIPTDTSKCYRFRQTTPNNFISSSDIDAYTSLSNHDSGIALFWEDPNDTSIWYDHQNYFSDGENSQYIWGYGGGVWVDSCSDDGDNFDSADSFSNTNYMYCAPTQDACDDFNSSCDTDCYNHPTDLTLTLHASLDNGLGCNIFSEFDDVSYGGWAVINYAYFNPQTVYYYVDEYDVESESSFLKTCNYWPKCNPADPCCGQDGNLRSNGYVCKSAHDAVCDSTGSDGCDGHAYEDRCTGTSTECPDNNYAIDYDNVCNDVVCVAQSCSGYTLQPERVCEGDTCQTNDPYECLYNLECLDSVSCKKTASSSDDCKTGYVYDNVTGVCWEGNQSAQNLDFDENGNLISFLGYTYAYNNLNQLVNVSYGGDLVAQYFYDADGNRFKKIEEDATTYYFDNFVQIHNSSGVYNETYYYLYDKLVGKKDTNGDILFYHPDHLGSTTLITDFGGDTVAYLKYNPYGELVDVSSERYTYTGHELDPETDNLYMKARYYNPGIGVFMQPDNIIGDVYNPQDLNKYAYVRNNPYKYTDPDGKRVQALKTLYEGGKALAPSAADIYSAQSAISYPSSDNPNDWSKIHRLEFTVSSMALAMIYPPASIPLFLLGLGVDRADDALIQDKSSPQTKEFSEDYNYFELPDFKYDYKPHWQSMRTKETYMRTTEIERTRGGTRTYENEMLTEEYYQYEEGGKTYDVYVIYG